MTASGEADAILNTIEPDETALPSMGAAVEIQTTHISDVIPTPSKKNRMLHAIDNPATFNI